MVEYQNSVENPEKRKKRRTMTFPCPTTLLVKLVMTQEHVRMYDGAECTISSEQHVLIALT